MVKVSIIVPVYNVSAYLEKCLTSLINQTLEDIEIIIINDGSTDDSQHIIDKYINMDKRIRSFTKENGGLGDARNYGLEMAKGEYIGFVDSDDYVDKTMFEKLYNKAIADNSDIVECDFYWCYTNKNVYDKANYYTSKDNIITNIRVMVCNKIYKREIIIDNQITFPVGLKYEDILFTYKILPYTNKISYIDEGLYYYVQRSDSLINNQTAKVRDIFTILDYVEDYYKEIGKFDDYQTIIEYIHIRYLLGSSYLRILDIKDKKLRTEILNQNWNILNNKYPHWKKNKYLFKMKSFKNTYYRLTSKLTYDICSYIFRLRSR